MAVQNIKLKDVLVDDSRFSLRDFLFEFAPEQTCHITSFDAFGILDPIIVYKDDKKRLHLVDGLKRVQFAILNKETMVRATVLPASTPVTDLITLILCNKRYEIEYSAINKIQFIYFASSLNAPESWIMNSLCIPFEFKPHRDFFRECERINNLPKELKLFCHDKKFSYKQLLNLTYHPKDLLSQLIKWKSMLQLTASTLDEIASNLKNYLKRENKKISDFLSEPDIQELFDSSLAPREMTEKLRHLIHLKQFPVLSDKNAKIQKAVDALKLPRGVQVSWDKTLENKNINLSVNISDPLKWRGMLDTLSSDEVKKAIESILDEL
ncbi:MAG: ParB N-terminal domain-containing protein [Nitrospirae bacterium]|nr:ParB N-terminal domain-containing protein [Nitrospirota bacterium]